MIEESSVAGTGIGEALRLKVIEKFTAGDDFSIYQVRCLIRNDLSHKVEFEKEEYTNFTRTLHRRCEPLVKYNTPGCCQVKDSSRRAYTLGFQFRFNIC